MFYKKFRNTWRATQDYRLHFMESYSTVALSYQLLVLQESGLLVSTDQFGFKKQHTTQEQVLQIVDKMSKYLEEKWSTDKFASVTPSPISS